MKKTLYGILTLMALAMFSACSGSKQASQTPAVTDGGEELALPAKDRLRVEELYYDATRAKMLEDYQEAVRLFEKVLRLEPTNDAAMYELSNIYFSLGQTDLAVSMIKKAVQQDEDNKWYQTLYAEIESYRGHYTEAAKVYEKLANQHPEELDFLNNWAGMLVKAEKYQEAIKVYDMYEELGGLDEYIINQKKRLYLKLGKVDKAVAEIQKLIDAYPDEPQYYGLLADLYNANDMPDKAAEVYKKLLEIDSSNYYALINMAAAYRKKGDRENYMRYMKQAFSNPEMDVSSKIRFMLPYFQLGEADAERKEEAFELAQLIIETHPEDAQAHALYGDLLNRDKQLDEAAKQYRQSVELDESSYEVWQQLFFIYSETRQYNEMLEVTGQALELFPNQPLIYFFNGVANSQLKNYKEATEMLNIGKDLVIDNPQLKGQFYSNLGDAYNNLGQYPKSDSAFEASLFYDPDNAYTLNNYSYYLSLRGEKLKEAKQMSARSNELEPNNASFEDTYAWILYKLGNYKESLEWMDKAMKSGGEETSSVMLEHYGDVLYQLGDIDKALEYWKRAESLGSESELIKKKIADKKLYE